MAKNELVEYKRVALLKAAEVYARSELHRSAMFHAHIGSGDSSPLYEQAKIANEVAEQALMARSLEWAAATLAADAEALQAGSDQSAIEVGKAQVLADLRGRS